MSAVSDITCKAKLQSTGVKRKSSTSIARESIPPSSITITPPEPLSISRKKSKQSPSPLAEQAFQNAQERLKSPQYLTTQEIVETYHLLFETEIKEYSEAASIYLSPSSSSCFPVPL